MSDNIISYIEMCQREGASLQQGMNFGLGGNHSVILMSVRPNAPYRDRLEDNGTTLVYEGHDHPKLATCPNPKVVDQPERHPSGSLTQNGKFHEAARAFKREERPPERVRVYEKIRPGIWAYNGVFHLIDSWIEPDDHRTVFKFRLVAVEGDEDFTQPVRLTAEHRRLIPTSVKLEVWKRDDGKCVKRSVVPTMNCISITSCHTRRAGPRSPQQTYSSFALATTLRSTIALSRMRAIFQYGQILAGEAIHVRSEVTPLY